MHAGLSNFGDQHEWTPTSGMDLCPLPISCLPGTQHLPSHSCPSAQKQMSQSQLLSPNTRTWCLLQTPPHPIPRNPFPSPKHISLFSCFRAPKTASSACFQIWKTQNSISKYRKHRTFPGSDDSWSWGPRTHVFLWSPKLMIWPPFLKWDELEICSPETAPPWAHVWKIWFRIALGWTT